MEGPPVKLSEIAVKPAKPEVRATPLKTSLERRTGDTPFIATVDLLASAPGATHSKLPGIEAFTLSEEKEESTQEIDKKDQDTKKELTPLEVIQKIARLKELYEERANLIEAIAVLNRKQKTDKEKLDLVKYKDRKITIEQEIKTIEDELNDSKTNRLMIVALLTGLATYALASAAHEANQK